MSGIFKRKQILCFKFHNFALHTFDEKIKLILASKNDVCTCVRVCVRVCVCMCVCVCVCMCMCMCVCVCERERVLRLTCHCTIKNSKVKINSGNKCYHHKLEENRITDKDDDFQLMYCFLQIHDRSASTHTHAGGCTPMT